MIEGLSRWKTVVKNSLTPRDMTAGEVRQLFADGKIAMKFDGPWLWPNIQKGKAKDRIKTAMVPFDPPVGGSSNVLAIPTVVPEGFPYVGLEALAAGTPVVGYANGGLPELVGPCGRLVRPGDRKALAEAIVSLLEDESLRRQLGGCGRERVAREFAFDRWVEAMRSAYRRAATMRSRSTARSS